MARCAPRGAGRGGAGFCESLLRLIVRLMMLRGRVSRGISTALRGPHVKRSSSDRLLGGGVTALRGWGRV